MNVWLAAMNQARRSLLARLRTAHAPPPNVSRNGHRKATCAQGARKRHAKARNLLNAEE